MNYPLINRKNSSFPEITNVLLQKAAICILFVFGIFIAPLKAEQQLPKTQGLVNDYAGILSSEEYGNLTQKLRAYEDSTGVQMAIVIEETHGGYGAFDRAMFIARGWSIGSKKDRSGVLIYVAMNDREFSIITSDNTQGKLPDGFVGTLEDEYLRPNFRNKQYYQGLDEVTTQMQLMLAGEFKSSKEGWHKTGNGYEYRLNKKQSKWANLFLFGFVFFIILRILARARKAKKNGVTMGGGGNGCLEFFIWSSIFGGMGGSGRSRNNNWGGGWGGGFGGDSSGGGSDWGGWGGGGGGFNGGGASGSW